ncbi:hypothetical protein MBLNU457_1647t2 [Dothideomycetes sp. NU457]
MPRRHGHLDTDETNEAAWVATRGALVGAARWGIYSAIAGGAAYYFSPVYRGLTFQFKVMIEADRRLRAHETIVRHQHRVARDAEVWRRYEEEFEAKGVPGIASEAVAEQGVSK